MRMLRRALSVTAAVFALGATSQDLQEETVFQIPPERPDLLLMSGTINSNTPGQLSGVLGSNPGVETIVMLQCFGSSDDDANFPMARSVRAKGLNTHLTSESEIYSGCVDFFLAGRQRSMEPGAIVGVHSWYDDEDEREAIDYPVGDPAHESNRKYIEDMLGSDEFYWFTIRAAPADGMYNMTGQEIERFGLITR
jgi:hypothetical protein